MYFMSAIATLYVISFDIRLSCTWRDWASSTGAFGQIRHNYNRLDDGHCDVTGHRKMSVLAMAGAMVTTHENSVMMRSFRTKIILHPAKPTGNEQEWWTSQYGVVYKLNSIPNLSRISDWSVHSGSYFFHSTGTFAVSTDSPLRR